MGISNVLPGRIPNALASKQLTQGIQSSQYTVRKLQEQISSGKRFSTPSEAPAAAIQAISLQKLLERKTSLNENLTQISGFLSTADGSLATTGDAVLQARTLAQASIGATSSSAERTAAADQVASLIRSVVNSGNAEYQGRYLFAGTETNSAPFEITSAGAVRYGGDDRLIDGLADLRLLQPTNFDGQTAFQGLTASQSTDLNAALTLNTQLSDLYAGLGVDRGVIEAEIDNGAGTVVLRQIDLSDAATAGDVKTRIENAFAGSGVTVTVDVNPATNSGFRLVPSAGTIRVSDPPGYDTAAQLGIASTAVASILGGNLDPAIDELTSVSALNGGAGIGATSGTGLRIVNGSRVSVIDLNGAATVGDVLSRIRDADPDIYARVAAGGRGIVVSSRLSGADFSIGENGGSNATNLGLRTFVASTLLSDLNHGSGVSFEQAPLSITRRDGSSETIEFTGSKTVQDVLDKINAVDAGVLVATLNATGNGISLTDSSGAGSLTVNDGELARDLGLVGSNNGGATGVLAGTDVNPQAPAGGLNLLIRLERALRSNDNTAISQLLSRFDDEASRVTSVRSELGSRQLLFENLKGANDDVQLQVREQLSQTVDTDLTLAISQLVQSQQTLQAALQVTAKSYELSLLNYL